MIGAADWPVLDYHVALTGFPTCYVTCAQNYWLVIYDIGQEGETTYKLGLN